MEKRQKVTWLSEGFEKRSLCARRVAATAQHTQVGLALWILSCLLIKYRPRLLTSSSHIALEILDSRQLHIDTFDASASPPSCLVSLVAVFCRCRSEFALVRRVRREQCCQAYLHRDTWFFHPTQRGASAFFDARGARQFLPENARMVVVVMATAKEVRPRQVVSMCHPPQS